MSTRKAAVLSPEMAAISREQSENHQHLSATQIGDRSMSQRLGDLLVKEKVITPEQLEQAMKVQKETNCRLGSALVKLNFLNDEDVTNFLSRQYGVPAINLSYFEIDPSVVKLIPYET